MSGALVVLAGAGTGAGVALAVHALRVPHPDLRSVLAHLDNAGQRNSPYARDAGPPRTPGRRHTWWARRWQRAAPGWARALRLGRHRRDLRLIGMTSEAMLARKIGYGLLGLAFPPLLALALRLLGVALPVTVPAAAGMALAAVLFLAPEVDVRRRAAAARVDAARAVAVYLELVALERAADAGTSEALSRAATVGQGVAFAEIRAALTHAQLAGIAPWQGLSELAEDLGVTELGDVADIMAMSGRDGAAVYATLRARASSLRASLRSTETAAANTASEHMVMPAACLGIVFMALIAYPAFSRIVFG